MQRVHKRKGKRGQRQKGKIGKNIYILERLNAHVTVFPSPSPKEKFYSFLYLLVASMVLGIVGLRQQVLVGDVVMKSERVHVLEGAAVWWEEEQ